MRPSVLTGVLSVSADGQRTWHPFLLADNRHYLFYVLRRVILPYRTAWHLGSPVVYLACLALWAWRVREPWSLCSLGTLLGLTLASPANPGPLPMPRKV